MDGGCNTGSPLLINLKSNGQYHLTSAEEGVWFDLNLVGSPRKTAWTPAGAEVGFVALDRNGNGVIDDGSELFGTSTAKRNGARATNGFDALADFDAGGGAPNGRIDSSDSVYPQLRLWVDLNHNGQSERDELHALAEVDVTALFTSYTEKRRRDQWGNQYRFDGRALVTTPGGQEREHKMYDVFLKIVR
jgi:hypothetical protein